MNANSSGISVFLYVFNTSRRGILCLRFLTLIMCIHFIKIKKYIFHHINYLQKFKINISFLTSCWDNTWKRGDIREEQKELGFSWKQFKLLNPENGKRKSECQLPSYFVCSSYLCTFFPKLLLLFFYFVLRLIIILISILFKYFCNIFTLCIFWETLGTEKKTSKPAKPTLQNNWNLRNFLFYFFFYSVSCD